ncbi:MAG: tRNA (adenosine(37)-N6)-threonylcarbamoyltransferase complex ATPase subunit type 1 TsaE [Planctomycetes bacterium]|jgi:tRNA threonylcarbamoyladenosine biosynthesis protein TsaE|nr:tRNA (adenosine(37)-N6)-threonylcarbamoyltransferase complex ATPase subunit type 1 TsaE [Planctomycetota bacterium]OUV71850.1 MAG: tRNA (adenosine(37)-N6)-threonylcarbamoyltransferase complex ATPase subunit type 1 TsaE [Planctomycetaceae bacterium TMED138]HAO71638.1 tRNA (adenosine(37)-N6)-threonylcarbamoyltransferase complex ATPase subunit type 1 TsaE [Planctomycetaceae bacterium]HBK72826.1 tRNA (adenosine(37)-N6)-threonylcarbamoyltransferase complex ATPase subunit type 1 TsaE [Planctomyceta|tara:strand:- start:2053 stop:2571 length:519 start_codon:yes stop_codon:yes gene_type:complete
MSSNESVESSRTVTCEIKNLDDLHQVASRIVKHLPQSALVTLQGELGAGKTTFVKAIADSVEIDPAHVTSPTFNLITIHESPENTIRLVHADMYRVTDPDELIETGWDTALVVPSEYRCWAFVEWPQKIASALPAHRLSITLKVTGESSRQLTIKGTGTNYEQIPMLIMQSS